MIISDEKLEEMRKEGTEFLDRLKDRVHEQEWEIDELKQEIERLNNIINEALGIANERVNYYHHTNKKEILEYWENIFNVLLRRDNE